MFLGWLGLSGVLLRFSTFLFGVALSLQLATCFPMLRVNVAFFFVCVCMQHVQLIFMHTSAAAPERAPLCMQSSRYRWQGERSRAQARASFLHTLCERKVVLSRVYWHAESCACGWCSLVRAGKVCTLIFFPRENEREIVRECSWRVMQT